MKNKIGIIVDSGASLRENKLKNIEVVPLIINEVIDKKINTYNDGVDLTREDVNKKISNKAKLSTSQSIFGECKSEPSGLRKTMTRPNSLAHRTTWLRSDLYKYLQNFQKARSMFLIIMMLQQVHIMQC